MQKPTDIGWAFFVQSASSTDDASHFAPRAMHYLIFANGDISASPLPLPPHDLIVAADGGARNAFKYGIVPDVLIGDFDSLSPEEIANFDRAGASPYRFPAEKDETDLELALDFGVEHGADRITLYGLFGGRWDMSFANLLLLASSKYSGLQLKIVEGRSCFHILRGGQSLKLEGQPGDLVSVIPLGGPAEGVSYEGLEWPLENATLHFGTPRGVSNRLITAEGQISFRNGVVLIVVAPDFDEK